MRLVVDTNQARLIPAMLRRDRPTGRTVGLTLPPFMLAEVLLRGHGPRQDTLEHLRAYAVRIGLEPALVVETLAGMRESQISRFEPFPAHRSDLDRLYRRLLREDGPTVDPRAAQWARTVKASNLKMASMFVRQSMKARDAIRRQRIPKADTFADAVAAVATAPDSFLESLVVSTISNGGRRALTVTDPQRLYRAVLRNPHLRHFFYALLFYITGISRLWRDQWLNRDAVPTRADWADLAVALYVGRRDFVVSADRLIRDVFAAIDPTIGVVIAADL